MESDKKPTGGRDLGMHFTLRGPGGEVVAEATVIACCFCQGGIILREGTDEATEHLLTCPDAPKQVKRIARAADALLKAHAAGQPVEDLAQELGYAVVDDLYERMTPEQIAAMSSDLHVQVWMDMNWRHLPPAARTSVDWAALARHRQRRSRPT